MPYYRRPYKRTRYGKTIKYSIQQRAFSFNADAGQTTTQIIVPATTLEGMRKVKHLTVNLSATADTSFYWVSVYVPQGTTVGGINLSGAGNV